LTLPMLYALQSGGPETDRLRELLAQPIDDDAEVNEALALLRTGEGLTRARDVLADQAAAARAELGKLPACPATDALSSLTRYVVDRTG
ncbi:MAG: polyprenyl synthetase family protein, partial [Pseudonocardia sp.]